MVKDIHRLANLGVHFLESEDEGVIIQEVVKSSLGDEFKEKQVLDPLLMQIKDDLGQQKVMSFEIGVDGILRYQERLCVLDVDRLQKRILTEAQVSRYIVHPGLAKMYHDLKEIYWWNII